MEDHLLRRAQQSGGSQTFQNVPNQQSRDFHPTWKFRAGTIPRLPAGRWCWWGNCGQRPRSTTMALPLHFGAKAQSHGGSTHDPHDTQHRQRKKWHKVALHRGGNWVGGQRRRRVLSKSDKVSMYSSYKLGRSGAVQIFTFSCVQNPRLQCLVFKWASLSH